MWVDRWYLAFIAALKACISREGSNVIMNYFYGHCLLGLLMLTERRIVSTYSFSPNFQFGIFVENYMEIEHGILIYGQTKFVWGLNTKCTISAHEKREIRMKTSWKFMMSWAFRK